MKRKAGKTNVFHWYVKESISVSTLTLCSYSNQINHFNNKKIHKQTLNNNKHKNKH